MGLPFTLWSWSGLGLLFLLALTLLSRADDRRATLYDDVLLHLVSLGFSYPFLAVAPRSCLGWAVPELVDVSAAGNRKTANLVGFRVYDTLAFHCRLSFSSVNPKLHIK